MKEYRVCCCHDNQAVFLQHAFESTGLSQAQQALLLQSFREVLVQIPLMVRAGDSEVLHTFTGYRVEHNHARGPFKGGLRFHQDVRLSGVRA